MIYQRPVNMFKSNFSSRAHSEGTCVNPFFRLNGNFHKKLHVRKRWLTTFRLTGRAKCTFVCSAGSPDLKKRER